jgi:hypothetical protein
LTEDLRKKRKDDARAILPLLHAAQRDGWHHLVADDEFRLFFDTSLRRMWTLSKDNVATKPRQQIQSKKFMFTIIWNPTGFYIVNRLLNDTKTNSDYFVTNVLISLEQIIFSWRRAPHEKRLMVSIDKCSVRTSRGSTDWLQKHGIHRMSDQSYSPNLATSDVYLFSTFKEKLERIHLADEDQFLSVCKGFWGVWINKN